LSQSGDGCKAGVSNADSWETNNACLLSFFEWNSLQALVQTLGIILRLGNLAFKDTEDGVAITSPTALEQVASMGIAPNTVEHALTHRIIKMSQDQVAVPLNAESAKDACDALVKRIYEIFDSVVPRV
jgi:myosin heavy subunit